MLETIRQLSRGLKLKELIIASFIPEDFTRSLEKRASWIDADDSWTIQVLGHHLMHNYRRYFILLFSARKLSLFRPRRGWFVRSPVPSSSGRRASFRVNGEKPLYEQCY
jgi:hypothetical protein